MRAEKGWLWPRRAGKQLGRPAVPRQEPFWGGAPRAVGAEPGVLRVAVFGLPETLRRVLQIVLDHAPSQAPRFVIQADAAPEACDVALVDMTAPHAEQAAVAWRRELGQDAVVTVGRRASAARRPDDVLIPRFSVGLLDTLNAVAQRCLERRARVAESVGARRSPAWMRAHPLEPWLGRRPRALVLEPVRRERERVLHALCALGIEAVPVAHARQALDQALAQRYELFWVAARLGTGSGFAWARAVKTRPRLREVPVILHNHQPRVFDAWRAWNAGCQAYVLKPVSMAVLQEAAERCLRRGPAVRPEQAWMLA